jgi:tellurite methyltransferase
MSHADRQKWDERYRDGAYTERDYPSVLLSDWLPGLLPAEVPGRALDVGCGAGRNALFLAESGFNVTAIDISEEALVRAKQSAEERNLEIDWVCADLESTAAADNLPEGPFDLVIMVRYVNLPLIPILAERLSDGGHFLCEEHLQTSEDVIGPENPAYRLKPNELLSAVTSLEVPLYNEGIVEDPDGRRVALARLIARHP